MPSTHPSIPSSFLKKKSTILASIATSADPDYTDKSPKGTIDAEIIDLIDEINAFEGYVTTSSCAGRVAVFVEGRKAGQDRDGDGNGVKGGHGDEGDEQNEDEHDDGVTGLRLPNDISTSTAAKGGAGPGGKGYGNKWLYVSHEPIPLAPPPSSSSRSQDYYHNLFNLTPTTPPTSTSSTTNLYPSNPRLIKLTFSPLILHILCSSLYTAKPLLAAAINSGFRESGVQSLKSLDHEQQQGQDGSGVMVAVRTAGCGFESVIGYVEDRKDGGEGEEEVYRSVVSEEWLGVLVGITTGRFGDNVGRRERFRGGLRGIEGREGRVAGAEQEWEEKEDRWRRKREEGLKAKKEKEREMQGNTGVANGGVEGEKDIVGDDGDGLGEGLFLDST